MESGEPTRELFERLWTQAEPAVLRVIFKRVGKWNRDDREDVLQRSRVRAWTLSGGIDLDELHSFPAWACQVAHWTCLEALRERQRRAHVKICPPIVFEDGSTSLELIPSEGPSPLELLLNHERAKALRAAVVDMPVESARAIALSIQDLSPSEIAHQVGTSVNTVRGRLHRGRLWARRNLDVGFEPSLI